MGDGEVLREESIHRSVITLQRIAAHIGGGAAGHKRRTGARAVGKELIGRSCYRCARDLAVHILTDGNERGIDDFAIGKLCFGIAGFLRRKGHLIRLTVSDHNERRCRDFIVFEYSAAAVIGLYRVNPVGQAGDGKRCCGVFLVYFISNLFCWLLIEPKRFAVLIIGSLNGECDISGGGDGVPEVGGVKLDIGLQPARCSLYDITRREITDGGSLCVGCRECGGIGGDIVVLRRAGVVINGVDAAAVASVVNGACV